MTLAAIAAIFYVIAALLAFRNREIDDGMALRIAPASAVIGCVCHVVYAIQIFWIGNGVDLAIVPLAMLVTVSAALITVAEHLYKPTRATPIVVVAYPLIAFLLLVAGVFHRGSLHPSELSPGLTLHVIVSVASYSILAYAACQAALLIWLDTAIRKHKFNAFLRIFPPLESAEGTLFNALWTGLALLTVANATGFLFFWGELFTHPSHLHVVVTFAAWLIYALLMLGHVLRGWRGKLTTKLSLSAFGVLLFGYFGTKLITDGLLT